MEQLYAPWRIEWVERETDPIDGCPFCVLPDRDADRDSRIVARGDHNFLLLNNAPYNPGHAMVIPYDHLGAWGDLSDAAMLEHGQLKAATIEAMEAAMDPHGVNTGMNLGGGAAGGSIDDHLHTHVVPRWTGDTNFMPIVSDTKVIVEAVDRTWEHLHEAFAGLDCAIDGSEGASGSADGADEGASDPTDAVRVSF
ncbi:HIT family protein [Haloparvum sedimenti]|uniref:HIT family protein n=1 Tax=Haloparvum sedimenti TaxID=1678448 RepID=UPI00071E7CEB|nr:HIT domain-containing protein [Haloparvum sedimenti]